MVRVALVHGESVGVPTDLDFRADSLRGLADLAGNVCSGKSSKSSKQHEHQAAQCLDGSN